MFREFIIAINSVHYRIGSLEKTEVGQPYDDKVHYRIGSLETSDVRGRLVPPVHYRIGSLEISIA